MRRVPSHVTLARCSASAVELVALICTGVLLLSHSDSTSRYATGLTVCAAMTGAGWLLLRMPYVGAPIWLGRAFLVVLSLSAWSWVHERTSANPCARQSDSAWEDCVQRGEYAAYFFGGAAVLVQVSSTLGVVVVPNPGSRQPPKLFKPTEGSEAGPT